MFIFNLLSFGGKFSSMSNSSSDSPSSKIWLRTGALFLEVRRFVTEGLRRRTTWVEREIGFLSSSSSSSSSSTLNKHFRPLVVGFKLTDGTAESAGPASSGISSFFVESPRALLRCPLRTFSAVRAGEDWGTVAWDRGVAVRSSSRSWGTSIFVGHDCLHKKWKINRKFQPQQAFQNLQGSLRSAPEKHKYWHTNWAAEWHVCKQQYWVNEHKEVFSKNVHSFGNAAVWKEPSIQEHSLEIMLVTVKSKFKISLLSEN